MNFVYHRNLFFFYYSNHINKSTVFEYTVFLVIKHPPQYDEVVQIWPIWLPPAFIKGKTFLIRILQLQTESQCLNHSQCSPRLNKSHHPKIKDWLLRQYHSLIIFLACATFSSELESVSLGDCTLSKSRIKGSFMPH